MKNYEIEVAKYDHEEYGRTPVAFRLRTELAMRLTHYALGLSTESAEIADLVKKQIIYGRPFDASKFVDEAGDVLWYLSRMLNAVGSSLEEAAEKNAAKLAIRFPQGFSESRANNKDKEAEAVVFKEPANGK